ncbi:solute carrier family 15 member 4-like isoform X3 [Symsagittifera roscoffensis]|uniref:solute carrier family 15 member 4-like isoform X3 n=1 Tax=Symsagittifera roscoffensis TaxID=84072 RepID=UPI00307BDDF8
MNSDEKDTLITQTIETEDEDSDSPLLDSVDASRKITQLVEIEFCEYQIRLKDSKQVFLLLLLSICLTTFAQWSILANLFLFLNMDPLHWDSDHANTLFFVFGCFCCVFAVLSGWLSDNRYSQYSVILMGHIPYLIGLCLFTLLGYAQNTFINNIEKYDMDTNFTLLETLCVVSNTKNSSLFLKEQASNCEYFVYSALLILAAGIGTLNVNIPLFLLAQVKLLNLETRRFFNWWLFSQIMGSLLCTIVVCFVQQNVNFFYGYLIGLVVMVLSLVSFLIGSGKYEKPEPCKKNFSSFFRVLKFAMSRVARRRQKEGIRKIINQPNEWVIVCRW